MTAVPVITRVILIVLTVIIHYSSCSERQTIKIHDVTKRDISGSASELHPETLAFRLEFPAADDAVLLHLIRRDSVNSKAPVFVTDKGKIHRINVTRRNSETYQSMDRRAAVTVTTKSLSNGRVYRSLAGIMDLHGDGTEYLIEVSEENKKREIQDGGVTHYVTKRLVKSVAFEDDELVGMVTKTSSVQKRAPVKYGVELLAVIDFSTFTYWKGDMAKITEYFAQVVNGIDMLYGNINPRDLSIYVRLAGFYIARSAGDSKWTDGSPSRQRSKPRDIVDAQKALDDLVNWAGKQTGLPNKDHTMLFTVMDIHHNGQLGTAGLAYTGAICERQAGSVVESHGGFSSITTGAHELGHSLGSGHDGVGNNCQPSAQNIMSASGGRVDDQTKINPYHFSSCSIQQFKNHINSLGGRNCLKNVATHTKSIDFKKKTSEMPGQLYDPDTQCKQIYGPDSGYCASKLNEMCYHLWCTSPGGGCTTKYNAAAAGSSCGNQKWCVKGSCVKDSKAPKMDESCMFGDSKTVNINGVGTVQCASFIKNDPTHCYSDGIRQACCGSCGKLANKSNPACMWGDKAKGCTKNACRVPSNIPLCCQTCA
ncbi:A disintegrin and metalloproteinase with thrombospondin motifs like [Tubulanus polymorphus]|uniref:A disintegrin and metalloproteinase with thrombospondin motifs like n=1 Tax=Tubulanus polymorphus TaxID=672921 RepID=UPI003DA4987E